MKAKNTYFQVLDKGFVSLVDVMGDDSAIVQAARTSYGKGTKTLSDDRGLIRYLVRNKHTSPLEMVDFKFFVQVPMDCWRQWIRHRTASVNEYSTRYSEAIDLRQETPPDKWRLQSKNNKQGSDEYLGDWPENHQFLMGFDHHSRQYGEYQFVVDDKKPGEHLSLGEKQFHKISERVYQSRLALGVSREQARKDLPLSTYTRAYWKINLHNLLHFLKLRADSHAQEEIQQYSKILAGIVKEVCPLAFEAWYDYVYAASNWTRLDKEYLQYIINSYGAINTMVESFDEVKASENDKKYALDIGMSKRELEEFWQKLEVPSYEDFSLDYSKAIKQDDTVST